MSEQWTAMLSRLTKHDTDVPCESALAYAMSLVANRHLPA